ncbi:MULTISPECIES: Na+/H+ antiporter subunit E [unclassified Nocardiopsis]|uniref:Na+/H+ antiporter subunit E n=1 Tax=unclassified Nocardiopsis TaxID=2649073 RepID=UPI001F2E6783|nr:MULTISPECIES: Na+/H+ antiporter subunit E [unclassified Nocardiopsis]
MIVRRIVHALGLPSAFGARVVAASARLAWDVLTPGSASVPAFVRVPLRCRSELEVTAIANMVTLTPGTVTVAIRMDPPTLWVYGMYASDEAELREGVRAMEDRLLAVTRADGAPARPGNGEGRRR